VYFTSYWHVFSESFRTLQGLNDTAPIATFIHVFGTNLLLLLITSPALACFGLRYDFPPVVLLFLVLLTFITILTGILEGFKKGPRLLDIYVCLYFLIYLIPPGVAYDRYLLPFLLYYIISEVGVVTSALRKGLGSEGLYKRVSAACVAFALSAISVALLYSNASAIYETLRSLKKRDRGGEAVDTQAITWVNANTSRSDVLVCYRDPMFYLYTGRKAVISSPLILFNTVPYQARHPSSDELRAAFLRLVDESSGTYLILSQEDFEFESDQYRSTIDELIKEQPEKFIPAFNTEGGRSKIYRIENSTR
jgi:hypothetical protein